MKSKNMRKDVVVSADMAKVNLKDPLINLMFNMMSGLAYKDYTAAEKALLKANGYKETK